MCEQRVGVSRAVVSVGVAWAGVHVAATVIAPYVLPAVIVAGLVVLAAVGVFGAVVAHRNWVESNPHHATEQPRRRAEIGPGVPQIGPGDPTPVFDSLKPGTAIEAKSPVLEGR